jgi:hypothetical protein
MIQGKRCVFEIADTNRKSDAHNYSSGFEEGPKMALVSRPGEVE